MRPLATTQLMMTWLSMCPPDESTIIRQKSGHIAHTLAVLIINVIDLVSSFAYCLKFISNDFDSAVFAFMIGTAEFGVIYYLIAAILMRHQNDGIFTRLSTIYKNNENDEQFRHLAQAANNMSEWMWKFFFKYTATVLTGFATMTFLSVLHCYMTQGNFNVDHFYRPSTLVLPWNQTTVAGYFGEICVTIPMSYGYLILNGTALLLFISLCLHHQAFSKMFKHKIDRSEKCDARLLCDLIRFHLSAKDLFLHSANVHRSFVLVQLICSAIIMTVSVFYLDLQWQHFDFTVASVLTTTSIGISTLFLYCYFGKLATESYKMMSDCVYQMDWYEQPNELQKHFILMIQNMRKSVYYHGFEVVILDLRTFIKLCNSVLSYYMAIKTLASK